MFVYYLEEEEKNTICEQNNCVGANSLQLYTKKEKSFNRARAMSGIKFQFFLKNFMI